MKMLSLFIMLVAASGCAAIPGLSPPSLPDRDRPECEWSGWQVYGEKVLGTEETGSVTFSIEGGDYTLMVKVWINHMVSLLFADVLRRECLAGGPEGRPVRTEYKTGETRRLPLEDGLFPVDIRLGDSSRWEALERSGEEANWAIYKGRTIFFVSAGKMRITDILPPNPVKTLILTVNGREAGRLYLHE
jgi:hypothetical protein